MNIKCGRSLVVAQVVDHEKWPVGKKKIRFFFFQFIQTFGLKLRIINTNLHIIINI